jgi:hypothetical protein
VRALAPLAACFHPIGTRFEHDADRPLRIQLGMIDAGRRSFTLSVEAVSTYAQSPGKGGTRH